MHLPVPHDPRVQRPVRDAKQFRRRRETHWCAFDRDVSIVAAIAGLLLFCSPSAIGRGVAEIVVYSVEGGARWPRPHVANELLQAVLPSLANSNPPTAVGGVGVALGVEAPALHIDPYVVERVPAKSVRPVGLGDPFSLHAPATGRVAGDQRFFKDFFFGPALASTEPLAVFVSPLNAMKHRESSKDLTRKIGYGPMHDFRRPRSLQFGRGCDFSERCEICKMLPLLISVETHDV